MGWTECAPAVAPRCDSHDVPPVGLILQWPSGVQGYCAIDDAKSLPDQGDRDVVVDVQDGDLLQFTLGQHCRIDLILFTHFIISTCLGGQQCSGALMMVSKSSAHHNATGLGLGLRRHAVHRGQ